MFTQSRDPNNKNKPAYKKVDLFVIEQTNPSLPVSKNIETMKINEMLMLDRNLLKTHLYSTFVHPLTIDQKDTIHTTEAEVRH